MNNLEKTIQKDDLTDLYNRRFFWDTLRSEIAKSKTDRIFSIAICDLDDFKKINDTYGHLVGDKLLVQVADIMKKILRKSDFAIRYAGDEFALIFANIDATNTLKILERLKTTVENSQIEVEENRINVRMSIGVAEFPIDGDEDEALFRKADEALYFSKREGKNRIFISRDIKKYFVEERRLKHNLARTPFINRDKEIIIVEKEVEQALKKEMTFVLISGEAGVGKTTLLEHLGEIRLKSDFLVILCRCREHLSRQPFSSFIQALDQSFKKEKNSLSQAFLDLMDEDESSQLATQMPHLKEVLSQSKETLVPATKKNFFELVLKTIFVLANIKPLAILIDDIHWADNAILSLIEKMSRVSIKAPILFIIAHPILKNSEKSVELRWHSSISRWLEKEIILEVFPPGVVNVMLSGLFGELELVSDIRDKYIKATGGNPLFLKELTQFLLEQKKINYSNDRWQIDDFEVKELPSSFNELKAKKIEKIKDPNLIELLKLGAVAGTQFNLPLIANLLNKNENYVLDLVDMGREQNIIDEKITERDDSFRFIDNAIKDNLYLSIDETTRRDLHKKIADTILRTEDVNKELISGIASHHYNQAGLEDKAMTYQQIAENLYDIVKIEDYIEELITEKEIPIDEQIFSQVIALIKPLGVLTLNTHLYPPDSSIIKETLSPIYSKLEDILTKCWAISFMVKEGTVLINGIELKAADSRMAYETKFIKQTIEHGLRSIKFGQGLTQDGFYIFIRLLGLSKEEIKEEKKHLTELLVEKNIDGIEVDEIGYKVLFRKIKRDLRLAALAAMKGKGPLLEKQKTKIIEPSYLGDIETASIENFIKRTFSVKDIKDFVSRYKDKIGDDSYFDKLGNLLIRSGLELDKWDWLKKEFKKELISQKAEKELKTEVKQPDIKKDDNYFRLEKILSKTGRHASILPDKDNSYIIKVILNNMEEVKEYLRYLQQEKDLAEVEPMDSPLISDRGKSNIELNIEIRFK